MTREKERTSPLAFVLNDLHICESIAFETSFAFKQISEQENEYIALESTFYQLQEDFKVSFRFAMKSWYFFSFLKIKETLI